MAKTAKPESSPVAQLASDLHFIRGKMVALSLLKDDPTGGTEPVTDSDWWKQEESKLFARLLAAREVAKGIGTFLSPSFEHAGRVETELRILLTDLLDDWLPMLTVGQFEDEATEKLNGMYRQVTQLAKKLNCAANVEPNGESAATHSEDFTSVNWFGTRYSFSTGLQAEAIRVLWGEWDKGRHTLGQKTIGDKIDSANLNFRLAHVFRDRNGGGPHPALNTMIQSAGKGIFWLVSPESPEKHP